VVRLEDTVKNTIAMMSSLIIMKSSAAVEYTNRWSSANS